MKWDRPTVDPLGIRLTLSGTLCRPATGDRTLSPIAWVQGVTVNLAQREGETPDWSRGSRSDVTRVEQTKTDKNGRFSVRFELRELRANPAGTREHQVGLALARHETNGRTRRVIWESSQPALVAATKMQELPAPPALPRELQWIKAASGWPREASGVELIRAVNGLRTLGKRRAIETLESYVELSGEYARFREHDIVFWIVRLLFEPIRPVHQPSGPAIAIWLGVADTDDRELWPLDPLEVVNGIPLMAGVEIGMGGMPERPSSYLTWARRYGVLRDEPLRPTSDPLAAVEALTSSAKYSRVYGPEHALGEYRKQRSRRDALAMVAYLDERFRPDESRGRLKDDDWRRLRELAQELHVVWDPVEQQYVRRP